MPHIQYTIALQLEKVQGNCVPKDYLKVDINLKSFLPKINITAYLKVNLSQKNKLLLKMATYQQSN